MPTEKNSQNNRGNKSDSSQVIKHSGLGEKSGSNGRTTTTSQRPSPGHKK
nr:MAG TPA: hypothetical protein [Caudoviricetes sp.]